MRNVWTYLAISALVLSLGIFSGWKLHKTLRPCPVITHDTTYVVDTVEFHIRDTVPFYVQRLDTILYHDTIPRVVDTAAILKDHFALHVYDRNWNDTNLIVSIRDTITQNKYLHNDFTYKILRPQEIIINKEDNSITYGRYITLGVGIPIKNVNYITIEGSYNCAGLLGCFLYS